MFAAGAACSLKRCKLLPMQWEWSLWTIDMPVESGRSHQMLLQLPEAVAGGRRRKSMTNQVKCHTIIDCEGKARHFLGRFDMRSPRQWGMWLA